MQNVRKGIAVSPGVAIGIAYCIHEIYVADAQPLSESTLDEELERYENALGQTEAELHAIYQKVATQVGPKEAAIFRSHQTILNDSAFRGKVRNWILHEGISAAVALNRLLNEYTSLFKRTKDEYLRERLADVRDVILRVSAHVCDRFARQGHPGDGPLILVADELLPSHAVAFGQHDVAGIVTQSGGRTSHAAILARGRGIPAVSGVPGILAAIHSGVALIVDGRAGQVIINPSSEVVGVYRKLHNEFTSLKHALAANRHKPAISADGEPVELLANINHAADAAAARATGASGVGLYRTEYLFLTHPDVPDEEEQLAAYREVIAESPNHRVTIRTLDLGGDKTIPYLSRAREANPFLGWRSIRLSFEHPEFFARQIRAILRAAAPDDGIDKDVRILFPMITTLEEMRRVRGMVRRASRTLEAEGKAVGKLPIGLMVEVPAAAISIDSLLKVADFVSIGSNDLVQYLMAADRDNPKVSHLCQPLAPAVLQVLHAVIRACQQAGKPVTLCGEMASNPSALLLLYGMGLRSFSMSPAFVPAVKELISRLSAAESQQILRQALQFQTAGKIIRFAAEKVAEIAPRLSGWNTA
jgi:phosphotransferase system enzyme I (PtsI)